MNLILCGYKSCGKTTLAQAYSKAYACEFLDTDSLLLEPYQAEIHHIGLLYRHLGAAEFRKQEAAVIQSLQPALFTIIATGGGVMQDWEAVQHLQSLGKIIYLALNPEVLFKRIMTSSTLPGFIAETADPATALAAYLCSRDEVYNNVCDHVIDATNKAVAELIVQIHEYRCHYG